MSSSFQPNDDTFDDVTGHKIQRGAADEATEGHRAFAVGEESDEAEGHRFKAAALPEEDDETEGHKLPVRGAVADEDDEVEGHRAF